MSGIAPGDYTLFAWETIPNTAYMNAGFMAEYEGRGEAVSVQPASVSSSSITAIRRGPGDR